MTKKENKMRTTKPKLKQNEVRIVDVTRQPPDTRDAVQKIPCPDCLVPSGRRTLDDIIRKEPDGAYIPLCSEEINEAQAIISREWNEAEDALRKAEAKISARKKETEYLLQKPRRFRDPKLQKMMSVISKRYPAVAGMKEKDFFRLLLDVFEDPEKISLAKVLISDLREGLEPEVWTDIMKIVTGGDPCDIYL